MTTVNFGYTGAVVDWEVPAGVVNVIIECWGAEGETTSIYKGGKGGYVKGTLGVTAGEILKIRVGGSGSKGGWNGGEGVAATPMGGGASDVRQGGTALADRKIVAAGGGGAGSISETNTLYGSSGGAGGADTGAKGGSPGGDGGSQVAGGGAGVGDDVAGDGSLGAGGVGAEGSNASASWGAGTGGGGYYGGGGGNVDGIAPDAGGGGGGSNYVGGVTTTTTTRGVRNGDGLVTITYEVTSPNTPTKVTPAAGATVDTDVPLLGMTLTETSDILQRGRWQLATDSGFTTNLRTITEPVEEHKISGLTAQPVPSADQLFQDTWHIRGRSVSDTGLLSAWTASHTFTVSHAPTTKEHSPTGEQTRSYGDSGEVELAWKFSDASPVDSQTAYQIQIERNSDGLVIEDTGKTLSADKSKLFNIHATYKDVKLRWRIRVWDSDDVVGPYSDYQLFSIADSPLVDIISPDAGSTINSVDNFKVQWEIFTMTGPKTQSEKRVRFLDDGGTIFDSGWIDSELTSYTLQEDSNLQNNSDYQVQVDVIDSVGLNGSQVENFSTSWIPPAAPSFSLDDSFYDTDGYILISWDNSAEDPDYHSYRVYRRLLGDSDWTLLHETNVIALEYTYEDYTVPSQSEYEYTVVQVVDRFDSLVESEYNPEYIQTDGTHFWLIDELETENSIKLYHVVSDSLTDEYEEETYTVLGAGRHVDFGSNLGISGTLSCEIRDQSDMTAQEQKRRINAWKESRRELNLRTPFGDYWQVVASNIGFNRTSGVGVREYGTLSIPYLEVGHDDHH